MPSVVGMRTRVLVGFSGLINLFGKAQNKVRQADSLPILPGMCPPHRLVILMSTHCVFNSEEVARLCVQMVV